MLYFLFILFGTAFSLSQSGSEGKHDITSRPDTPSTGHGFLPGGCLAKLSISKNITSITLDPDYKSEENSRGRSASMFDDSLATPSNQLPNNKRSPNVPMFGGGGEVRRKSSLWNEDVKKLLQQQDLVANSTVEEDFQRTRSHHLDQRGYQ